MDWRKCPSVTPGGKPYFYVSFNGQHEKTTVVWSRLEQKWLLIGDMASGVEQYGLFNSPKAAMAAAK